MIPIPDDLLHVLVCSDCGSPLRRGPVFQLQDGAALCGSCAARAASPAWRCRLYEALARLVQFPCRYRAQGCAALVPFGDAHENGCEYRQFPCPVLRPEVCSWTGLRGDVGQHVRGHGERMLLNGGSFALEYDVNASSTTLDAQQSQVSNYFMFCFDRLFLLHIRVCVVTSKLHCVVWMTEPQYAHDYDFTLTLKKGENSVSLSGEVVEQQEESAIEVDVNSVAALLSGWVGVSLSVTVRQRGQIVALCQKSQESHTKVEQRVVVTNKTQGTQTDSKPKEVLARRQPLPVLEKCIQCQKDTIRFHESWSGWMCKDCTPIKVCTNKGCNFKDFENKIFNHSYYFCPFITKCCWNSCKLVIQPGTLLRHFHTCPGTTVVSRGSEFRVSRDGVLRYFLVDTDVGHVICECWYSKTYFFLRVNSSIPIDELSLHRCMIRVTFNGPAETYTPDPIFPSSTDWELEFKGRKFDLPVKIQVTVERIL